MGSVVALGGGVNWRAVQFCGVYCNNIQNRVSEGDRTRIHLGCLGKRIGSNLHRRLLMQMQSVVSASLSIFEFVKLFKIRITHHVTKMF